jgi:hypothetical protein
MFRGGGIEMINEKTGASRGFSLVMTVLLVLAIVLVSVALIKGIGVEFKDRSFRVKGIYGVEVRYDDIESLELLSSFPLLGLRTNGIGLGFMNVGHFTYGDLGKVRLFEVNLQKPYLSIKLKDERIVIGMGKSKNEEYYSILKGKLGR